MITVNTGLLSRESSVTGRFSEMENGEFGSEIDKTWNALNDVQKVISQHVKAGNLRPIEGIRGFAALSANVLGYEEFVPRNNTTTSVLTQSPNS